MALTQDQTLEYNKILRSGGTNRASMIQAQKNAEAYKQEAEASNAALAANPDIGTYNPDLWQAFGQSQAALDAYNAALNAPAAEGGLQTQIYDPATGLPLNLAQRLQDVGAYQAQDYLSDPLASYKGPVEYQKFDYNFADQYKAPEEYQAYQYKTPEIADIQSVQPMADELWGQQAAGERERIGQQFKDTEAKIKQAAIQNMSRPEQIAALLAEQGIAQQRAQTEAQRALDIARAQQNVGIAQTEQGLQAQRGTQQAQLQATVQEQQAQEMAKKYGLDVDAARYIVQQQQTQQTAQAGEAAKAQDQALAERATAMGLEQAQREAKAAEYQKQYQSQYGLAQDVAQTQMAQNQAEQAAKLDKLNAQLQGQQAASQQAAQQATYQTNLTEGERNELNKKAQERAVASTTVKATAPTTYQMPASTAKAGGTKNA